MMVAVASYPLGCDVEEVDVDRTSAEVAFGSVSPGGGDLLPKNKNILYF